MLMEFDHGQKEDTEKVEAAAQELLYFFSHHTADALLRVTRNTLEMICKRTHSESDSLSLGKSSGQQPILRVNVNLSIPDIVMVPALEEVQQALNQAVDCVVSVSKGVSQWSEDRVSKKNIHENRLAAVKQDSSGRESEDGTTHTSVDEGSISDSASSIQPIPFQTRNCYKSVSKNK
ncbi:dynein heavy chain 5, axonemal, partial [Austrofundulus limnaeus]|uniref:Dynein heavy chain 5, axonemal n=1 Tax=Austrofundulus limnaeus TaxID=52670 RepID=A0A2I4ALH1_AUSLI